MRKISTLLIVMLLVFTACGEKQQDQENCVVENNDKVDLDDDSGTGQDNTQKDETQNDETQNDETQNDQSSDGDTWLKPAYEYNGDASTAFLSMENHQLIELQGNTFSATYTHNGQTYEVQFEWCVVGNKVVYKTDKDFPDDLQLETINGCTNKILIAQTARAMDRVGFKVCDLENNTIEPLLGGRIDAELAGAYELSSLNPEWTSAIVVESETGKNYYFDMYQTIDLGELISKQEGFEFVRSLGRLFNDEILIYGMVHDGDWTSCDVYTYRYLVDTEELITVLDGVSCADIAWYEHFRYLTHYQDGELFLLDPYTGRDSSTGMNKKVVQTMIPFDDDYILVIAKEGYVCIYNAETGRNLAGLHLTPCTEASWTDVLKIDGIIYIRIYNQVKTYIYEMKW